MNSIEKIYKNGRKIIMEQYPEYYLWDFYRINDDFEYIFKDIPPDKSNCLVIGLKIYRNRGTSRSFTVTGFVRFFGEYYKKTYNENIQYVCNISDILKDVEILVKEKPGISEQDFMSWLLDKILDAILISLDNSFASLIESKSFNKRIASKIQDVQTQTSSIIRYVFALNGKDETFKTSEEMDALRNTYEIIQQRPLNYFQYHMEVEWQPQGGLSSHDESWFKELFEKLRKYSVVWFLDFVYRLRNALFHEILDPLAPEWQLVFKNAYLVLKEIVDLNIDFLNSKTIDS